MRGLPPLRSDELFWGCLRKKANLAGSISFFYFRGANKSALLTRHENKKSRNFRFCFLWAMRGSNPRPPRCKRGALNQLS